MSNVQAERDARTPPVEQPDGPYWVNREEWPIVAAALLLETVEPRRGLGKLIAAEISASNRRLVNPSVHAAESRFDALKQRFLELSEFAQSLLERVLDLIDNAKAADRYGRLDVYSGDVVRPREFLLWAREREYTVPDYLKVLIQDMPSVEELQQKIKKLEAELEKSWEGFDPESPNYPQELDIALQAWQAVRNGAEPNGGTPRQRLEKWIRANYELKSEEMIDRIAKVANFEKGGGRPPKKK